MARRRRAYEETTVSVSKSRSDIDKILKLWGVSGIQWEDDFEAGQATLRFKWTRETGKVLVARFRIMLDSDADLKEEAVDKRNGKFSQKKYERLLTQRGNREHRVLAAFIKNAFEAIEDGIITAEALLMPWLEDSTGATVYEKVEPVLDELASAPLHRALTPSKGKG